MNTKIEKFTPEEVQKIASECVNMKQFQIALGYGANSGKVDTIIKDFCNKNNISLEHFTNVAVSVGKRTEENIFIKDSTAAQATLRRWYKKGQYTEYKCAICGMEPIWNGEEITLTLDHINGDNRDDRLENLRWVCPNCDRQLDTFAGKNQIYNNRINKKIKYYCKDCGKEISAKAERCLECKSKAQRKVANRPSADELKQLLEENNGNFTAVGRLFEVNDNTIRKWCKGYNMPSHTSDYKTLKPNQGSGKRLNYLQVIKRYNELQNAAAVAREMQADPSTILEILKACEIEIKSSSTIAKEQQGKKVAMYDKNNKLINTFNTLREAGLYIYQEKISTSTDIPGIATHIGQACSGKRQTAYGHIWKYLDSENI